MRIGIKRWLTGLTLMWECFNALQRTRSQRPAATPAASPLHIRER
jgi:hypothetical protein